MSKQIFKKPIESSHLFDILEQTCIKNDDHYIIDINAYKKIKFHNLHINFLESISEYYHTSKKYYIEREFTYNSFTNIVRQICKFNNIRFTSNICYNHSTYYIHYIIYFIKDESKEK
uniref:Uncharacterized protein n=1 Tax=viral metagenome TaxID=1070528 RepID=A0A6C0I0Y3_9ZZZZ